MRSRKEVAVLRVGIAIALIELCLEKGKGEGEGEGQSQGLEFCWVVRARPGILPWQCLHDDGDETLTTRSGEGEGERRRLHDDRDKGPVAGSGVRHVVASFVELEFARIALKIMLGQQD